MKVKPVVLYGESGEYIFTPSTKEAGLRKVSKFSRVYKGQSSNGLPVVIKILPTELAKDPYEVACFKNEVDYYGIHANLQAPFEYIFQDDTHHLVVEYVSSVDLGYFFRNRRNFRKTRIKLALQCGLQLLDAVGALHQKGYVHADIKPANVLLLSNKNGKPDTRNPQFKLIDFGLTRKVGHIPPPNKIKTKRPFVLVYSPPEQVLGFQELIGPHSDFYTIALLMYEMIVREPAYNSNLSVKLINLQMSFPLPASKLIPPELMRILQKAAAKYHFKKPPNHYKREEVYNKLVEGIHERYSSATDFWNDLLNFYSHYFSKNKS